MLRSGARVRSVGIGLAAVITAAFWFAPQARAQRRNDWDWDGNYQRLARINSDTYVTVRTTRPIESDRADGQIYPGVVADDVWDDYHRLAVPAIPRGSRVDLLVRSARDGDLVLDLQTIYANGQAYAVNAAEQRVDADSSRHGAGEDTAQWVGGGAVLGTIIGAIAGGGKGAAIGAGAGAAAGLGLAYRGRSIKIPDGSELTFRLNNGMDIRTDYGNRSRR